MGRRSWGSAGAVLAAAIIGLAMTVAMAATPAGVPAAGAIRCIPPPDLVKPVMALPQVRSRLLTANGTLRAVAIGSSSTQGAGSTAPDRAYPARLAQVLQQMFPGRRIAVLNRGKGGETAVDNLNRFDSDVLAHRPDLVIWQVGSNELLRRRSLTANLVAIARGISRLKQAGIDVILMDLQFAPSLVSDAELPQMLTSIAQLATRTKTPLFRRYAIMKRWFEEQPAEYGTLLAADRLHLNDAGYDCIARTLAVAIGAAVRRP